jgi:hypothetical protein
MIRIVSLPLSEANRAHPRISKVKSTCGFASRHLARVVTVLCYRKRDDEETSFPHLQAHLKVNILPGYTVSVWRGQSDTQSVTSLRGDNRTFLLAMTHQSNNCRVEQLITS